jgi:hypothetical protein
MADGDDVPIRGEPLAYSTVNSTRWRTNSNASAGTGTTRDADDSSKTSRNSCGSPTVLEHSNRNLSDSHLHSRDNRKARSSLTACPNLVPSRQAGASLRSKLLQVSPVAMRKQAYPTDQATEIEEDGRGSRGGERHRGRRSR